ncbi:VCBS repeat-containing protein [Verrucomicrobiales bacterium]|nr:VCBS repeat-containing protein [Verrucomicrobiales bacterium]
MKNFLRQVITSNYVKLRIAKGLESCVAVTVIFLCIIGCTKNDPSDSTQEEQRSNPTKNAPKEKNINPAELGFISKTKAAEWEQIDDPSEDGWETEFLANQANKQLKELGSLFFNEGSLNDLVTSGIATDPLTPENLELIFKDKNITVHKGNRNENQQNIGTQHLEKELNSVRQKRTGSDDDNHAKFKIIGIKKENGSPGKTFTTEVLFSLNFRTEKNVIEKHARWSVQWNEEQEKPKIEKIRVLSFNQTTSSKSEKIFTDVTGSALDSNDCYKTQLSYGMNHWLTRLPVRAMLNRFGTPGISIGDVNGDGLEDIYLCQEPGLPNRLFIQRKNGTLMDVSAEWGVDWLEDSRSSIIADFDNDGDQDLAVAVYGMLLIAKNDQQKRFVPAIAIKTSWSTASLAAADYDKDGLLDLYVCAYVQEDNGESIGAANNQFVYHDAENGAPNLLFKNETTEDGKLSFVNTTEEVGLNINNQRWSFAASWEDFDNDGDQDLYVANDYGRNNLYRNDAGKFTDIAANTNTEDSASGMSVTWADYDRDGRMDLYVSNMFSAAGNRITEQQKFKSKTNNKIRDRFRRFARGNTLLRNIESSFEDKSISAGVNMGRWAWGSNFVDLNNDSLPDLVVANGYLTSKEETGDL